MMAAELYGKISPSFPPHNRMEDVLTSYVFSLFRYLNNVQVMSTFLASGSSVKGQRPKVQELRDAQVFFWPCFTLPRVRGRREADALLILTGESPKKWYVVVEAKLDSGLTNLDMSGPHSSNDERGGTGDENSDRFGHQLADEFCAVLCGSWSLEPSVIEEITGADERSLFYVTSHYEFPKKEMEEALQKVEERSRTMHCGNGCGGKFNKLAYWVSWRELYNILKQAQAQEFPDYLPGEKNILKDLALILEQRGLRDFQLSQLTPVGTYERWFSFQNTLEPVYNYKRFLTADV